MMEATTAAPAAEKIETTATPAPGAADKAASGVSGTAAPPKTTLAGGAEPKATPAGTAPLTPATGEPKLDPTWRDRFAGDDKDFRKQLERYSDEGALGRKLREMEKKISSGALKPADTPFPDKGTAEEQTEWRKAQGIPDKPEAYLEKLALPSGMVLGEADKPVVSDFATFAHSKNWSPEKLSEAVTWYYGHVDKLTQERDRADGKYQQQARDELRDAWGAKDFEKNMNAVHNLMALAPHDARVAFMDGRTVDGRTIGDDPRVLRWLAQVGTELNPEPTQTIGAGGQPESAEGRYAEMRKQYAADPNKYDFDKPFNAEMIRLKAQIDKKQSRGKAA